MIVRDISRTGVGLLTSTPYPAGSRFIVLLPKNDRETFRLLCEVVRVTHLLNGDGAQILGMRMIRRVSMEEYTCFLVGKPETVVALTAAA